MDIYYEKGRDIVKKLLDSNYQAFFVGGFVRDHLLGLKVTDIDITTDALPSEIQALFPKTKATGLRYGTITVFKGAHAYEVTTFRTDGKYLGHRKPEEVHFSKSLEEDLARRDFTINALAMDYQEKIIDCFNGRNDLELQLIKAIGDPKKRFVEDALRILRAFRFVAKLGFDIERDTLESITTNMKLLTEIASERIIGEFKKILDGGYKNKALRLISESGIGEVFPELNQGLKYFERIHEEGISYLEFFAMCFYLYNQEIPDNWRFSNKEKAIMYKIMELISVTETDEYNEMIIYRLGIEIPLMANNVSRMINPDNDQELTIRKIYQELPVKKTCDLTFKGQDILELTSERNAEVIGDIIDDLT